MDKLEEWRVRGRVATAIKNVREALTHLAANSQELDDAVAEAEHLGLYDKASAGAGVVR